MRLIFHDLATPIGMIGVVLIVFAYLMLQIDRMTPESIQYSVMNLMGSLCLIYSLMVDWNLSAFIINIVWLIISLYGFFKSMRQKNLAS